MLHIFGKKIEPISTHSFSHTLCLSFICKAGKLAEKKSLNRMKLRQFSGNESPQTMEQLTAW